MSDNLGVSPYAIYEGERPDAVYFAAGFDSLDAALAHSVTAPVALLEDSVIGRSCWREHGAWQGWTDNPELRAHAFKKGGA